jgi:hypothetical protein
MPRRMDAPAVPLKHVDISTYSAAFSTRKQDVSPNQISSSHESNRIKVGIMTFPNQSRLIIPNSSQGIILADPVFKKSMPLNRSPNK